MVPLLLGTILANTAASVTSSVIGTDDRVQTAVGPREMWPIGLVTSGWFGLRTSGTLIDRCHVLTAKHLLRATPPIGHKFRFRAMAAPGRPSTNGSVVAVGAMDTKHHAKGFDRTGDWLLLRLDRCLGEQLGTIPLANQPLSASPGWRVDGPGILSAGYPDDRSAMAGLTVDPKCQVQLLDHQTLVHDCAAVPGDSGGPILVRTTSGALEVVAIHSASKGGSGPPTSIADANRGLLVESFLAEVRTILSATRIATR
jgi:V8-like Glu-specific endopeptidase